MLVVETRNPKEAQTLGQIFQKDGHSFAVPFKQIDVIERTIDLIAYEVIQQEKEKQTHHTLNINALSTVRQLLLQIIKNAIHLNISLDLIREALSILIKQEKVFEHHIQYIQKLDEIYGEDQQYIQGYHYQRETSPKQFKFNNNNQLFLQSINTQLQQNQQNLYAINNLKCQIVQSPKFFNNNFRIGQIQDMSSCSSPKKSEVDRNTDSTLYQTPQKIENCYQLKYFSSSQMLSSIHHKNQNQNEILSSRFLPTPSVLLQENIIKMTRQEQREDIKRSLALHSCIHTQNQSGEGSNKSSNKSLQEKLYSKSIKMIKMKSKMRSISRQTSNKSKNIKIAEDAQGIIKNDSTLGIDKKAKKNVSIADRKNQMISKRQTILKQNKQHKLNKQEQICHPNQNQPQTNAKNSSDRALKNFFKSTSKFK